MYGAYLNGSLNGLSSSKKLPPSSPPTVLKRSHSDFFAPCFSRVSSDGPLMAVSGVGPRCGRGSESGPPRMDAWKKAGWPIAFFRGVTLARDVEPNATLRPGDGGRGVGRPTAAAPPRPGLSGRLGRGLTGRLPARGVAPLGAPVGMPGLKPEKAAGDDERGVSAATVSASFSIFSMSACSRCCASASRASSSRSRGV